MSEFLDEIEASVPALRRYARALTRNPERADDLVQDCIERAIRKRLLWRPTGQVKSWLFRILLNLYRNELRVARRRGEHIAVEAMLVEPAVAPAQPGRIALAEMARAIDTLGDDQREALLLVVLDGMSYAEAADAIGVPIGTLMSRLGRARATLKTMTGSGDEPRLRTVK